MTTTDALIFFTGLVTLFCPPVAIALYASVTGHFPRDTQKKIAVRLFVWIAVVLTAVAWLGQYLLGLLGITMGALNVTGGLVMACWSIPMLFGTNNNAERNGVSERLDFTEWSTLIAVPIIFPLSIGAVVASLVIATSSRFHATADLMLISAVCMAHSLLIALTYFLSAPLYTLLGKNGMKITERLSGIVLTAIALQMMAQGTRELLPGLAH